jgi:hypothetical protein
MLARLERFPNNRPHGGSEAAKSVTACQEALRSRHRRPYRLPMSPQDARVASDLELLRPPYARLLQTSNPSPACRGAQPSTYRDWDTHPKIRACCGGGLTIRDRASMQDWHQTPTTRIRDLGPDESALRAAGRCTGHPPQNEACLTGQPPAAHDAFCCAEFGAMAQL